MRIKVTYYIYIYRVAHIRRSQNEVVKFSHGMDRQQKANAMVLQTWKIECLKMYKISDKIINVITNNNSNNNSWSRYVGSTDSLYPLTTRLYLVSILLASLYGIIFSQRDNEYMYLPTPPQKQDETQGQFSSEVKKFRIQSFSSPIAWGTIVRCIPFWKVLALCEM